MSFRNNLAILSVVVGFSTTSIGLAEALQVEKTATVTLSSLVQHVYQQHPAHHNEHAQQQRINANTELANSLFADASSMNVIHKNDVVVTDDGFQEWEAFVDMPLWLSGQKQSQLILSEKMAAEIPAYQQQIRLESSAKVRELIWNVILAETAAQQAYQGWQTAQKLHQDVTARVKAGELAGTERLLASTHELDIQSQYILAQAALEHALNNYQYFTGETTLPQRYEETLRENSASTQQHHSLAIIEQQHPSLVILDQKINTLKSQQDVAGFDGAVNPNLSLGMQSGRGERGEHFNNSVTLGISFALDDKVYRRPAVAEAAKALADAEISRQQLERQLNTILRSNLHTLETKQQQLGLINSQDKETQQYLALQQRAFELGEIDLVNVLRSQSIANEVHNRKQLLQVEIKQLIAQINQALGIIP
jgi:outer membrane protein, heavy metal efflux system